MADRSSDMPPANDASSGGISDHLASMSQATKLLNSMARRSVTNRLTGCFAQPATPRTTHTVTDKYRVRCATSKPCCQQHNTTLTARNKNARTINQGKTVRQRGCNNATFDHLAGSFFVDGHKRNRFVTESRRLERAGDPEINLFRGQFILRPIYSQTNILRDQ